MTNCRAHTLEMQALAEVYNENGGAGALIGTVVQSLVVDVPQLALCEFGLIAPPAVQPQPKTESVALPDR